MPNRKIQKIKNLLNGDKNSSILSELEMLNDSLANAKDSGFVKDKIVVAVDYLRLLTEYLRPIKLLKGDKGDDGYTPQLGVDFQTPRDGIDGKDVDEQKIVDKVLSRIAKPRDGKDADVRMIIKKVLRQVPKQDKVEPINKDEIVKRVLELVPPPQDGRVPKHEIKGQSIRFENPDGTWGEWIHLDNLLGTKTLHRGGLSLKVDDVSDQVDGITQVFTTEDSYEPGTVTVQSTQFPIIFRPIIDFTETGQKEITLVSSQVGPIQDDQSLIITYSKNGG